jgi:hypothetical protein
MKAKRMGTKTKTYPNHDFENAVRERGLTCQVLWEEPGPSKTAVAWIVCYRVGRSIALVQTYDDGNGWEVYTPSRESGKAAAVEDALRRCGALESVPAGKPDGDGWIEGPDGERR